jgi:hypothetical protein
MILTYEYIERDDPIDDAILIQFGEEHDPKYGDPIWVPRNVIINIDEQFNEIEILDWFAIDKYLDCFGV